MKLSYLLIPIVILLASCSSDDVDYVSIQGRVQRTLNGDGIAEQSVTVMTRKAMGSGLWSSIRKLDEKKVVTDENGNFTAELINDVDAFITIAYEGDDDYFGSGIYRNYPINEPVIIGADKFIKFKILVHNSNPVDENDFIHIDFYAGLSNVKRTGIENLGTANIPHPAEGNIGAWEETAWTGTNVNSIVYYSVRETAEHFKIRWFRRKNNIETDGFTNDIPYDINQVNTFDFEY